SGTPAEADRGSPEPGLRAGRPRPRTLRDAPPPRPSGRGTSSSRPPTPRGRSPGSPPGAPSARSRPVRGRGPTARRQGGGRSNQPSGGIVRRPPRLQSRWDPRRPPRNVAGRPTRRLHSAATADPSACHRRSASAFDRAANRNRRASQRVPCPAGNQNVWSPSQLSGPSPEPTPTRSTIVLSSPGRRLRTSPSRTTQPVRSYGNRGGGVGDGAPHSSTRTEAPARLFRRRSTISAGRTVTLRSDSSNAPSTRTAAGGGAEAMSRASSPYHCRRREGEPRQRTVTVRVVLTVGRRPSPVPRGHRPPRESSLARSRGRTRAAPRWKRGAARP